MYKNFVKMFEEKKNKNKQRINSLLEPIQYMHAPDLYDLDQVDSNIENEVIKSLRSKMLLDILESSIPGNKFLKKGSNRFSKRSVKKQRKQKKTKKRSRRCVY